MERLSSLIASVLHPPKKHTKMKIPYLHKLIYMNNLFIYTAFSQRITLPAALRIQLKKSPHTDRLFTVKT